METKICIKCGVEKVIDNFPIRSETGKYRNECKECQKIYNKKYQEQNKDKIKEYIEMNKEKICKYRKEYNKKYRKQNKDKIRENGKKYREQNKNKIKEQKEKYYFENREEILERRKKYRERNRKELLEKQKKYYMQHKEQRNEYEKNRLKNNKEYRLKAQIRNLIRISLKNKNVKKNTKTEKILGINTTVFVEYLLKTFENNYGYKWDGKELVHIDHIIPLATAKTEEDVIKLCNYTNLQLLKAKDNLKKGAKTNWKKE